MMSTPVKETRVCYTCQKCGLVLGYEEQPCPHCALRAELNSLRAHNGSLKAKVEWFEREQHILNSIVGELRAEIARLMRLESEATMQANRDAARADANAAECGRLNAELAALRARVQEQDVIIDKCADEAVEFVGDNERLRARVQQAEALATALAEMIERVPDPASDRTAREMDSALHALTAWRAASLSTPPTVKQPPTT